MNGLEKKKRKPVSPEQKKVRSINLNISPENFELLQTGQSSVEIRRGPKSTDFTVKTYGANAKQAAEEAITTFNKLSKEYDNTED